MALTMTNPERLWHLLAQGETLTIVCHNNPDPDCLASAVALGTIAAKAGIDERHILYSGRISHQQNRALVNLLDIELEPFDADAVRDRPDGSLLALVDHSVPGRNNDVPEGTDIDVIIDHHSTESVEDTDSRFVDTRDNVGTTATILTQYVRALPMEPDERIATALLFAIRRATLDFLRGVTSAEYAAAGFLHDYVESDLLRELSTPAVSGATVDTIADAIEHRTVHGSVLISPVGRTRERDALPQAADYLVTLEGVQTTIVFGLIGTTIHISARSTDPRINVGDVLERAFEDVGSAGGHRELAGGAIPLGIFAEYSTDDTVLLGVIDTVTTRRLLDALNIKDGDDAASTA